MKNIFKEESAVKAALLASFISASAIYIYYFLLIPQTWSLMDDYAYVINWGKLRTNAFAKGLELHRVLLDNGRFRPMDVLARVIRHVLLPIDPRYFHLGQIFLLGICFYFLKLLLEKLKLKPIQVYFGLFLALSSFVIKDWIVYSTSAESLATLFLIISLYLYVSGKRFLAILPFVLMLLSKESFFITLGAFFIVDYFQVRDGRNYFEKYFSFPILALCVLDLIFIFYVKSLPQVYTSHLSIFNFSVRQQATALMVPVFKNFGMVLVLVAVGLLQTQKSNAKINWLPVILGFSIIVPYTFLLALWGPFDSWFYLHVPIPFGWVLILASLWRFDLVTKSLVHAGMFLFFLFFSIVVVLNGSKNLTDFLAFSKTSALIACEDSTKISKLNLYSNCPEGSGQLHNMLVSENLCENPPEFKYFDFNKTSLEELRVPYEIIASQKCEKFDVNWFRGQSVIKLPQWLIIKRFQ